MQYRKKSLDPMAGDLRRILSHYDELAASREKKRPRIEAHRKQSEEREQATLKVEMQSFRPSFRYYAEQDKLDHERARKEQIEYKEAHKYDPFDARVTYHDSYRVDSTGHYWDSLSRAGVFDAIHDRRCYATTGAPILLSFSVNGAQMGEVLSCEQGKLAFRIHTICPEEIERISIYRNTELIERVTPQDTKDYEWCIEREATDGAYYAEVVQRDHEYAWSSPILYRPEG